MDYFYEIVSKYGYLAILLGCFVEGETVTLLGGMFSHKGIMNFWQVIAAAALGGFISDTTLFFCGRQYGITLMQRLKHKQAQKITRVHQYIGIHPILFVFGVRFMYGFRIIGPVIIGTSGLVPIKFIAINMLAAIIWSTTFVLLGYICGQTVLHLLA